MKKNFCLFSLFVGLSLSACAGRGAAAEVTSVGGNDVSTDKQLSIGNVQRVARVTGEPLPGEEQLYAPNHTGLKYDVYGTDLGIMWQIKGNHIGLFFGDTNGAGFVPMKGGGNGSNWRSNVLAFSSDTNLDDGLTIDSMLTDATGKAREVCAGGKANPQVYQTSIPTSAIHANGLECVHYMNIYEWAAPHGRWLTNFSSLYTSADGGATWQRQKAVTFGPDSHFSQIAYAKRDGWVYMLGTQAGRGDDAYLARFREADLLHQSDYEFWNGDRKEWVRGDETAATPVIPAPVGEASLMWQQTFKRWIVTYQYDPLHDPLHLTNKPAIVYRTATDLTQWGKPHVLLDSDDYPALYCAFLHPLKDTGQQLWFIMSMWGPYDTYLMRADLSWK